MENNSWAATCVLYMQHVMIMTCTSITIYFQYQKY